MRAVLLAAIAVVVTGCSSPPVLLDRAAEGRDFLATDSKLRIITTADQGVFSTAGLVEAQRITCTEPSPDVATTIANSFAGSFSLFGRGAGSLSAQQVEGLVQLGERTAAIRLLRDKMYQTCIAYSNGAISGTTYSLIMSRLDDAIVTLSLGDSAAGAFGRRLAALGGGASGSAEGAVAGLPADIAKIEEQAGKLAAANTKVDDAAKALEAHKATKPEDGKEGEYNARTSELEKALTSAKAERNALLELMRSTANAAAKSSARISEVHAGGGLTGSPNAQALREMQGDFLLADSTRDLIFACVVELGLRGDGASDKNLEKATAELGKLFIKEANGELKGDSAEMRNRIDYVGAVLRGRGTALAKLCRDELRWLISDAATKAHEYRQLRAKLSAETSTARYRGESARIAVRERELFIESLKTCNAEFKEDADRRNACLDKIIPIQTDKADAKIKPKPAPPKAAGR